MPSHSHSDVGHVHPLTNYGGVAGGASFAALASAGSGAYTSTGYASLSNTGGGAAHTHGLTLGISYLDLILCQKN